MCAVKERGHEREHGFLRHEGGMGHGIVLKAKTAANPETTTLEGDSRVGQQFESPIARREERKEKCAEDKERAEEKVFQQGRKGQVQHPGLEELDVGVCLETSGRALRASIPPTPKNNTPPPQEKKSPPRKHQQNNPPKSGKKRKSLTPQRTLSFRKRPLVNQL